MEQHLEVDQHDERRPLNFVINVLLMINLIC